MVSQVWYATSKFCNLLINLLKCNIKLSGPIFSVGLGSHKSVVIGDYEILKDLFKLDAVTDRPPMMQWFNPYFRCGNGEDARGILFRFEKLIVSNYSQLLINWLVVKGRSGKNRGDSLYGS